MARETQALGASHTEQTRALAVDLAALLGFSGALVVTAGLIKTPMGLPGHSALFWMPVLVLAGAHRRAGTAAGAALCGGGVSVGLGVMGAAEFGGLILAGLVLEGLRLLRGAPPQGLWLLVAGLVAHLGKLAVKLGPALIAPQVLNGARLGLSLTAALYAAFGLGGGVIAWGALAAWRRWGPGGPRGDQSPTPQEATRR